MTKPSDSVPSDPVYGVLWADGMEEVDREIARLAMLCRVRILDPGVVARVLKNDASVCGTQNAAAFRKLHELVMLHLAIRQKFADSFGQGLSAAAEDYIIERLRKSYPELDAPWPPG